MLLSECNFLVFDTETTGINPAYNKIIEFAALKFTLNGEILETFDTLINPQIPIPAESTRINNITDAMVASMPEFFQLADRILTLTENTVLVGHNVGFDIAFLNQELKCAGKLPVENQSLDTLNLARNIIPGLATYKLGSLAAHLGINLENAHRALDDVKATKEIFLKIIDASNCTSYDDLIHFKSAETRRIEAASAESIKAIEEAMSQKRYIVITYVAASSPRPKRHKLIPLEIQTARNLLKVYHPEMEKELTFRIDRITEISLSDCF